MSSVQAGNFTGTITFEIMTREGGAKGEKKSVLLPVSVSLFCTCEPKGHHVVSEQIQLTS